jgi:hypothetical protein
MASPNLDSFIEWTDNPLANAIQKYQHNSKIRWLAGNRWDEKTSLHICYQSS